MESFLFQLAMARRVLLATKSQALNAIMFLYRKALNQKTDDLAFLRPRARQRNVPTILPKEKVIRLFSGLQRKRKLMAV